MDTLRTSSGSSGSSGSSVVGRRVGQLEGFTYSPALSALNAAGEIWTPELLNAFLTNPVEAVPGNRMPFGGIADERDRANLLAYLATLVAAAEAVTPEADRLAEETAPRAVAANLAGDELAALVAGADALAGEDIAGQCGFCHTFDEGGSTSIGPNLFGIVGRAIGAAENYLYSQPLLDLNAEGAVWTLGRLDAFIADPATGVPGNRMPFTGIPDATKRVNLLAFLAGLLPGAAPSSRAAAPKNRPEGFPVPSMKAFAIWPVISPRLMRI